MGVMQHNVVADRHAALWGVSGQGCVVRQQASLV
jgi:hypothetical protein